MRALLIIFCFLSFSSFAEAIDIDIKTKEWKKLDFPNRFPQTFFVSNKLLPMYFGTGENTSQFNQFLVRLNESKPVIDLDEDDIEKIKYMMQVIMSRIKNNKMASDKNYLINISVDKLFECQPCTNQTEHIKQLNLKDVNVINIYLI